MNTSQSNALRDLVHGQPVAALGTLHEGQPFVSMVPFAVLPDGTGLIIHVSHLASHTKDMLHHPEVSMLVMSRLLPGDSPLSLPRVTIQGTAAACDESSALHAAAKAAYVERLPQSAEMFDFTDFQLFVVQPSLARFVGGFARATTVAADALVQALRKAR
jgi:putative heme iron utilization protein